MLRACGLKDDDFKKPLIGVANTWIEIGPCNYHLRELAQHVKEGIRTAGGTPLEFNTVSISDGITMGTDGMRTSLVSREVIADSIELVTRGNLFDALIVLVGCDKTIPGGVMALARLNIPAGNRGVRRGVEFLKRRQEPDGTWYGRWGCNYIYGTWLALSGLAAAGEDLSAERFQRAGSWLRRGQNKDGGWGELPHSYDEPGRKGMGPSTPSQTAWALLALFALGDTASSSVRRGVEYLLRNQRYDGSWKDDFWTGTGFPKVFYLRYHLYATYFPLWALAAYRREESRRGTRDRVSVADLSREPTERVREVRP